MKKRIFAIFISISMFCCIFSAIGISASAYDYPEYNVPYLSPVYNEDGNPLSGLKMMESKVCGYCYPITEKTTDLYDQWYIVNKTVSPKHCITVHGDCSIILANTGKLSFVNMALIVSEDASLTIYGQEGNKGELFATGNQGSAGIGGASEKANGKITINGGTVTGRSCDMSAGIGGGERAEGKNIIINGGIVEGRGGIYGGAGIGGGDDANGSNIIINGGEVTAVIKGNGAGIGGGVHGYGEYIYINGGKITTEYEKGFMNPNGNGAGIGGGEDRDGRHIYINGGTLDLVGGKTGGAAIGGGRGGSASDIIIKNCTIESAVGGSNGGAGIGGGEYYYGGAAADGITIENAKVTARGCDGAAGIGGGQGGVGKNITIKNSDINATGGSEDGGAGIGGGEKNEGQDITIINSTVVASGGKDSAGIGSGHGATARRITIENSTVTAYGNGKGAGIGGGEDGWGNEITIMGDNTYITATGGSNGGAGIGGGCNGGSTDVNILGGTVNASGNGEKGGAGIGGGRGECGKNIHIENTALIVTGGDWASAIGGGATNTKECGNNTIIPKQGEIVKIGREDPPTQKIVNYDVDLTSILNGNRYLRTCSAESQIVASLFSGTNLILFIGGISVIIAVFVCLIIRRKRLLNKK